MLIGARHHHGYQQYLPSPASRGLVFMLPRISYFSKTCLYLKKDTVYSKFMSGDKTGTSGA